MSIPLDGWTPFTSAVQVDGSKLSTWEIVGYLLGAGIAIVLFANGVSEIWVMVYFAVGATIVGVIGPKFSTHSKFPKVHDPKEVPPDRSIEEIEKLKEIWRDMLQPDRHTWVLFSHGTCVLVPAADDAESIAIEILKQYGPLAAGTHLADFRVRKQNAPHTYLVGYAHPSIFNVVHGDEAMLCEMVEEHNDALIGSLGRGNRVFDAKVLKVVYVEN
jgi:hypothetical protein